MQQDEHTIATLVIVEDDFLIAAAYRAMAEEIGINVLAMCDTADAGIAAIIAHQPTFALLDVQLAGPRDGVHVATAVLQNEIATRIIFATGSFDAETLSRLHGVGAFQVLVKPIDPNDFAAALSVDADAQPLADPRNAGLKLDRSYIAQMTRVRD